MSKKFYLTFGALHIAFLLSDRAKKKNISSVGQKVFWKLFLFCKRRVAKNAKICCPIRLHVKRIN